MSQGRSALCTYVCASAGPRTAISIMIYKAFPQGNSCGRLPLPLIPQTRDCKTRRWLATGHLHGPTIRVRKCICIFNPAITALCFACFNFTHKSAICNSLSVIVILNINTICNSCLSLSYLIVSIPLALCCTRHPQTGSWSIPCYTDPVKLLKLAASGTENW